MSARGSAEVYGRAEEVKGKKNKERQQRGKKAKVRCFRSLISISKLGAPAMEPASWLLGNDETRTGTGKWEIWNMEMENLK